MVLRCARESFAIASYTLSISRYTIGIIYEVRTMTCPTPAGRKILGSHFCKHGGRTRIKFARFDPQLLVMWIDCRNLLLISASLIKNSSAIYLIFHCFWYVWSWVNSGLWKLPVEMLYIGSLHFSALHLRNTTPQFFIVSRWKMKFEGLIVWPESLLLYLRRSYVSVKSKLQHAPPGHTPGI